MTLKKADFNTEVKSIVASGPPGIIWMCVNPATGAASYRLEVGGDAVVESKDLDRVLNIYNRWESK